jgi:primosomal protein N' (replication factor Y)
MSGAGGFVDVALPLPVGQSLTYSLSADQRRIAVIGARVRVPLGSRRLVGFVAGFPDAPPDGVEARSIVALLDRESPFPDDLFELAKFAASYYLSPLGDVLAAIAPPPSIAWGEQRIRLTDAGALAEPRDEAERRLRDLLLDRGRLTLSEIEVALRQAPEGETAVEELSARIAAGLDSGRFESDRPATRAARYLASVELAPGDPAELRERCGRSPAGRAAVDFLATLGRPALATEVQEGAGCGPSVLKRLADLGVLRRFSQPETMSLDRHLLRRDPARPERRTPIVLRPDQEAAVAALIDAIARGTFERFLLQGQTGSGKTEIYLRAAARAIEAGRDAILLVPEISLVPALATEARERFGELVAVLHSGLGDGERAQEWERIRTGSARVVVGARSALFAPVRNLGLIAVDEEQDLAYKQDSSPRYHGRDLALMRAKLAGGVAVLVSATPGLETRLAAQEGRVAALRLTASASASGPAEGIVVDLRDVAGARRPGEVSFSPRLLAEIERTLANGDQAILLRNRRGYAPLLLCRACGEEFRCDACGLPRTFHRRAGRMLCHYCGSSLPVPSGCPSCGGETLEAIGAGTERVEELLGEHFPGLAIDVLDRDTARRSGGPAAILERFARGETRLLVGTQMISKGHHFPRVALTGVLFADGYLGFPDFRAVEKTYSLLTQIAGRSGRGERPGRFVLQTFVPSHYAIRAALERDDAAFAEQELRFRRAFNYPPYTRMVQLLAKERRRERALERLERVAAGIAAHPLGRELRVTGPAPAPLERLRGEWRFQLLLRGSNGAALRQAVRDVVGERPGAGLAIDVDPYHLL